MEDHTNQFPALAWPLKHCRSQSQGLRRPPALFMQGLEVGKEQSQGEYVLSTFSLVIWGLTGSYSSLPLPGIRGGEQTTCPLPGKDQDSKFGELFLLGMYHFHTIVKLKIESQTMINRGQSVVVGFPGGSDDKESACNAGDLGSIPRLGRSPGGGHGKPTPVFLPRESHGQRSLAGYSPWAHKESDTTQQLSTTSVV